MVTETELPIRIKHALSLYEKEHGSDNGATFEWLVKDLPDLSEGDIDYALDELIRQKEIVKHVDASITHPKKDPTYALTPKAYDKQMKSLGRGEMKDMDKMPRAVLGAFFDYTNKNGVGATLTDKELAELLPNFERGPLGLALLSLHEDGITEQIGVRDYSPIYKLKTEIYKSLQKNSQEDTSDEWEPLAVENYEEVSASADDLAEAIESDNGYVAKHPEEARFTASKLKSFGADLLYTKGKVVLKSIKELGESVKKLLDIFDKTTRIGELIMKLINLLNQFSQFF